MTVKIAHISDIHWRSLKRHDEYKKVFKKCYEKLSNLNPDLIYIGGDIVHSKTQGISPEIIENLTWNFNELAKIAPVHVILGNHDGLILNTDRQDAITPIINALDNDRIFLYKKSGVYPTGIDGYSWCVFSCFDEENWKNVKPSSNDINIACFHGAVRGSKTDVDWELEGEVNLGMFDEYDFGLFGDIHKFQYLDSDKRVAYPGSLIQQNYGEDIKKGFLFWEINNRYDFKSKLVTIPNPHPFVTIEWQGNVEDTIKFCEKVKKSSRFRIKSEENISQAEIKLIHYYLKHEKSAKEIVYQNISKSSFENKKIEEENCNNVLNIRSKSDRTNLIKSLYNEIDDIALEKLDNIFIESLDKIPESLSVVKGQDWSINNIEFSNTFSYGKNNYINFNSLNGVVGIFGNNRTGKSSIPGTLMYTLFNTTDRGAIKNLDIVNIRKGSCKSKVNLSIGSENYDILRETIKKSNRKGVVSATTSLSLKRNSLDFEQFNETEEQRRETEKVLRKLIGTSEDFLYTSFASQGEINTFIKEKSSARKSILSKFLSLEIYEEIYKNSREDYIVLKSKLKNIEEKNWSTIIEDFNSKIKTIKNQEINNQKDISDTRQKEVNLRIQLNDLEKDIKSHPSGYTIDSAKKEINYTEDIVNRTKNEIKQLKSNLLESNEKIKKIDEFKKSYSIESLEAEKQKLDSLLQKLNFFKQERTNLVKEKRNSQNEIKILDQVPCGNMYQTCKFISKAHEAKKNIPDINDSIIGVESSIYEIKDVVKRLQEENLNDKIKKYNSILNKEYKLKIDIEGFDEKINSKSEKLCLVEQKIKKLSDLLLELDSYNDDSIIEKTNSLKHELNCVQESISNFESLSRKSQHEIFQLNSLIEKTEKERLEYQEVISKWKMYDMFTFAVSKKGIPTLLINSYLPKINAEINNILSGVTSFKIEISDNQNNNNLEVYIDYGDSKRIIECGSGMEKMMASIAIRVALINISSLPKSDIFIIDEGFGALDESNIEACGRLLKSLKRYFKTILIISHVDSIKDIVDKNIEISIKGQDSYVDHK